MSKGESLTPHESSTDFALFPAASLYFLYCLTAKLSGFSFATSLNSISTAFSKFSSFSEVFEASIICIRVSMFFSFSLPSKMMSPKTAE